MSRLASMAGKAVTGTAAPFKAKCGACGDWGYTGCQEARVDTGDLLALAYRRGVACSCPSGGRFAAEQMRWMDMDAAAKAPAKQKSEPQERTRPEGLTRFGGTQ